MDKRNEADSWNENFRQESIHASIDAGRTRGSAADMLPPPGEATVSPSTVPSAGYIAQEHPNRSQKFPTEQGWPRRVPAGMAPGMPHSGPAFP